MATTLIVINVVGGTIALAAASVTSTPVGPTFPNHATYILGLFLVNGIHGVMHLLIGTLGLFVLARKIRAEYYLTGHTIWFGSLGVVGLVTAPRVGASACHSWTGYQLPRPCRPSRTGGDEPDAVPCGGRTDYSANTVLNVKENPL